MPQSQAVEPLKPPGQSRLSSYFEHLLTLIIQPITSTTADRANVTESLRRGVQVILDLTRRTARFARHLAIRRWVHRRHKHKLRRKSHCARSARNRDVPFLQG